MVFNNNAKNILMYGSTFKLVTLWEKKTTFLLCFVKFSEVFLTKKFLRKLFLQWSLYDVNNKILYWEKFSQGEIFAVWPNCNFFYFVGIYFCRWAHIWFFAELKILNILQTFIFTDQHIFDFSQGFSFAVFKWIRKIPG